MITIDDEITVPYEPQRVWEVLSDPAAVASCIKGAELTPNEDGTMDGTITVKFGAIRVVFRGTVILDYDEPTKSGKLSATGKDGQGATRFNGEGGFSVVEDATAGGSRLILEGEVSLGGKLASLVESGAGMVIRRTKKDFAARLIERCGEPAQSAASNTLETGQE